MRSGFQEGAFRHILRTTWQNGQRTHLRLVDANQLALLQQAGKVGDVQTPGEVCDGGEHVGPGLALHLRHEIVDLERVWADGRRSRGVRRQQVERRVLAQDVGKVLNGELDDFFGDGSLRAQAVFNGSEDVPHGVELPPVSRRLERQRGLNLHHAPTL
jgi:hypothetical protein